MPFDKSIITIENVSAGNNNHLVEHPQAIPSGEKWVIKIFKAGIESKNDGFSGNIVLRFGNEILSAMILYGATQSDTEIKEIIGDGTTRLNLLMQNPSNIQKKFFARIKAYKQE